MQSSELDRRLQIVREIAVAAGEVALQFYDEKNSNRMEVGGE